MSVKRKASLERRVGQRGEEGERGGGAEGVEERGGGGHRVLELLGDAEDEVVGDGGRRARHGGGYRSGRAAEAKERRRRTPATARTWRPRSFSSSAQWLRCGLRRGPRP